MKNKRKKEVLIFPTLPEKIKRRKKQNESLSKKELKVLIKKCEKVGYNIQQYL